MFDDEFLYAPTPDELTLEEALSEQTKTLEVDV